MDNLKDKIKFLENQIIYHNKKYWEDDDPEISDEEFDNLENELKKIDPENTLIKDKIEGVNPTNKIKHSKPMLSLDKIYNLDELFKWCKSVSRNEKEIFRLEPKLDGISGDYSNKLLLTRGKNSLGVNISNKIPIINYIGKNKKINLSDIDFNVRGELIIKKDIFNQIKSKILKTDGKPYKTARGACSGLLIRDNCEKSFGKIIDFVDFNTFSSKLNLNNLKSLNWDQIEKDLRLWEYSVDGIVIKLDDEEYSHSLGYTSHHPKGQIAFKFSNPKGKTILKNVIWSLGKKSIIPIGILEPVIINQAEISRLTLHNGKFILDKDLHIGDEIIIERCGEITPHLVSVIPGKNRQKIILINCPNCGSPVDYLEPNVYCTNIDCDGSNIKKLYDSIIRIGITNIGKTTVKKIYETGIVKDLIDLFELPLENIKLLEGFAEKSSNELFNEINKIRKNPIEDWRILSSLNINGLGTTLSKKILKEYNLFDLIELTEEELILINDIGKERAIEIVEGLYENENYIHDLISYFPTLINTKDQIIKGNICFTGSYKLSREELIKIVEKNNFNFCKTVVKNLTYLVTDDINKSSKKIETAKNYGIKIISYEDFFKILKG